MSKHFFRLAGVYLTLSVAGIQTAFLPLSADALEEYTAKSLLTLNLARYSEWPPDAFKNNKSHIQMCLFGREIVPEAFAAIDNKSVGNKTLTVQTINDIKDIENCHLLYVATQTNKADRLLAESSLRHILTIGESSDFLANGGMVYLAMSDSKINLHISLNATQKAGVQISARVLKLATIYNP